MGVVEALPEMRCQNSSVVRRCDEIYVHLNRRKKKIELKRRSEEGQGCEAPSDNRVLEPGECQLLDQCSRGCTRKENFGPAITCL